MKMCPICHVEYSDEAEFCPKSMAKLNKKDEVENAPFEKKRLLKAIFWTCGFMLVVAGIYYVIGLLSN